MLKKFLKYLGIQYIIFSFFVLFGFVFGQWIDNDDFLDDSFWSSNPSTGEIIDALYGDGSSQTDKTAYTNFRTGVTCDTGTFNRVNLFSGDNIPLNLNSNTIYVLHEGIYITTGIINFDNCTSMVGSGDVYLYSENLLDTDGLLKVYNKNDIIIDNVNIDGYNDGEGGTHNKNARGILFNMNSFNNTINNIKSFNNEIAGVRLHSGSRYNLLNNLEVYNNNFGLVTDNSNNNLLNNILSYNNTTYGIKIIAGINNSINNTQIFNNNNGLLFQSSVDNLMNNLYVYNNLDAIVFDYSSLNKLNNIKIFNNQDVFVFDNSVNNYYYGELNIFENNNFFIPSGLSNSGEISSISWITGYLNTGGIISINNITNPINNSDNELIDNLNDRGNDSFWNVSEPVYYRAGTGSLKQKKIIQYSGTIVDNSSVPVNTGNSICEDSSYEINPLVIYSETGWTYNDVVVTITGYPGDVVITNPSNGSNQINYSSNGSFDFEYQDSYGVTGVVATSVTGIDKTPPFGNIVWDPGEPNIWTGGTSTGTLIYSTGDGGSPVSLLSGTTGVVYFTGEKQTYTFGLQDEAGLTWQKTVYSKIDRTSPTGWVEYDITGWTNTNVVASVQYNTPATGEAPILVGNSSVEFLTNGIYNFVLIDEAGNKGYVSGEVDWIDKTPPTGYIEYIPNTWTGGSVQALITGYGYNSGESPVYVSGNSSVVFYNETGEYVFTLYDDAGNITNYTGNAIWLDKTKPSGILQFSPSGTGWTSGDVSVLITGYNDGGSPVSIISDIVHIFTGEDMSYDFILQDQVGNIGTQTVLVDWIDKTPPTGYVSLDITGWTNTDVVATLHFSGNDGGSPVNAIGSGKSIVFETNGVDYFHLKDQVGHISVINAVITGIDKIKPNGTVLYTPNTWTSGNLLAEITGYLDTGSNVSLLTSGSILFTGEDQNFIFKLIDQATNTGFVYSTSTFIDKTLPTGYVLYSTTGRTSGNVSATFHPNPINTGYEAPVNMLNSGTHIYTGENQSYLFELVDMAGNYWTQDVIVDWIDQTPPSGQLIYSTTGWTSGTILVTLTGYEDTGSKVNLLYGNSYYEFTYEGYQFYNFELQDEVGNYTSIIAYTTGIDFTKPVGDIVYSTTGWTSGNVSVTIIPETINTGYEAPIDIISSGTYLFTGENQQYTFVLKDSAGNIGTQTVLVDWIDQSKPILSVNTKTTNSPSPVLTGILNETGGIKNMYLTITGKDFYEIYTGITLNTGSDEWFIQLSGNISNPAIENTGSYLISIFVEDNVGFTGVATGILMIDNTVPYGGYNEVITNNISPYLSGGVEKDADVWVEIDGTVYTAVNTNNFYWYLSGGVLSGLDYDYYDVKIFVENKYGATGSNTYDDGLLIDNTPPIVTGNFIKTKDHYPVVDGIVSYTGAGLKNTGAISIDLLTYNYTAINTLDTWYFGVSNYLNDGNYTYNIEVFDLAGNTGYATGNIIVDNVGPIVTITTDIVSNKDLLLSGEIIDDVDISALAILIDGELQNETFDNDSWEITLITGLSEGTHSVTMLSFDELGNASTYNISDAIIVDSSGPTGSINSYLTNDDTPIIDGTYGYTGVGLDLTGSIQLIVSGNTYFATYTGGNWEYEFTTGLDDGYYEVVLNIFDRVNNLYQITGSLEIDTTPLDFLGISNNEYVNYNVSILYETTDLSGALLNGQNYVNNSIISGEGNYVFTLTDLVGNTTGAFFVIDKTKPGINGLGVVDTINYDLNISNFDDNLSGVFINGTSVNINTILTGDGIYNISLLDKALNTGYYIITIDQTLPNYIGVNDGVYYSGPVNIEYSDTNLSGAKLNGSGIGSPINITGDGNYNFYLDDLGGNIVDIDFVIDTQVPTFTGVSSGDVYNKVKIINFEDNDPGVIATLNGSTYQNGQIISDTGVFVFELVDQAGNKTGAIFEIDEIAGLYASMNNLPDMITSSANVNISVSGYSVVSYKYGINQGNNCSGVSYSSEINKSINITQSPISDGEWTYCVLGKDGSGVWQDILDPSSYTFLFDTIAPTGTVYYDITEYTTGNVNSVLNYLQDSGSTISVVNTGTHMFSKNGSFTFILQDEANNITNILAVVDNIIVPITGDDYTGTYNMFVNKGYENISGELIGDVSLDMSESSGNLIVPFTIKTKTGFNSTGDYGMISFPGDIIIKSSGELFTGIIPTPSFVSNSQADEIQNQDIIGVFELDLDNEINFEDSSGNIKYVTVRLPAPGLDLGDEVIINISDDGDNWNNFTTGLVIDYNGYKYVEFETSHFTFFAIGKLIEEQENNEEEEEEQQEENTEDTRTSGGGGGGGGGIRRIRKDDCLKHSGLPGANLSGIDYSSSYYDRTCLPEKDDFDADTDTEKDVEYLRSLTDKYQNMFEEIEDQEKHGVGNISGSPFTQELNNAYLYAYDIGITTMPTIHHADMYGTLIRKHLAKMITQFAVEETDAKYDDTKNCEFDDMENESEEMQKFAILACKYGLMGLKSDGTSNDKFNPNGVVTRAIFGTTLSRALYGNTFNGNSQNWYIDHLLGLQSNEIMNYIDEPNNPELRGYVMLMMKRASEK